MKWTKRFVRQSWKFCKLTMFKKKNEGCWKVGCRRIQDFRQSYRLPNQTSSWMDRCNETARSTNNILTYFKIFVVQERLELLQLSSSTTIPNFQTLLMQEPIGHNANQLQQSKTKRDVEVRLLFFFLCTFISFSHALVQIGKIRLLGIVRREMKRKSTITNLNKKIFQSGAVESITDRFCIASNGQFTTQLSFEDVTSCE